MTQTCENAGFLRNVSPGQYFRTVHDVDDGFGGDSGPVGWICGHEKIGPVIQVKVTYYSEQSGSELQVKSVMNDGPLSRIMISRGTNKHVEEVYEEKGVPSYHEEMASGTDTAKPIATQRVYSRILPPRRSYRLTNESGKIFQPRLTS